MSTTVVLQRVSVAAHDEDPTVRWCRTPLYGATALPCSLRTSACRAVFVGAACRYSVRIWCQGIHCAAAQAAAPGVQVTVSPTNGAPDRKPRAGHVQGVNGNLLPLAFLVATVTVISVCQCIPHVKLKAVAT